MNNLVKHLAQYNRTLTIRYVTVLLGLMLLLWSGCILKEIAMPLPFIDKPASQLAVTMSLFGEILIVLGMFVGAEAVSSSIRSKLLDMGPMFLGLIGGGIVSDVLNALVQARVELWGSAIWAACAVIMGYFACIESVMPWKGAEHGE